MISFFISLFLLVIGYVFYGRFVERMFGPDDRPTPATTLADGVDYVVMPNWKVFLVQFLNIAGTGPIFGAIMGAKFGPACYLWIVFGCIFAGAVHDYFVGMISMRHGGVGLPTIVGKYLGNFSRQVMLAFTVFLLIMVSVVFVYSPAAILSTMCGDTTLWIIAIFFYYLLATVLPVDKVIGRIYPVFAFSLLFMAVSLFVVMCIKMPQIPEVWDGLDSRLPADTDGSIYPFLFITVACGALSGFHATQSPLMARCLGSERMGRPIFYGSMITEGVVALIWAAVSSYFFYGEPEPGYKLIAAAQATGFATAAPNVVHIISTEWLGMFGGILAILGVVAAPITSGDTALRSARIIIADAVRMGQRSITKRFIICVPLFLITMFVLLWQIENPKGFNVIWNYFGWANQTLAVFALWTITVYLAKEKKPYYITLFPAIFMTGITLNFLFVSNMALHQPSSIGLQVTGVVTLFFVVGWLVYLWRVRKRNKESERQRHPIFVNSSHLGTKKKHVEK
ncbi:MAG: carbon starvation protein A [Bacteroidaceae bacterium]|nr:carbon starvation protein A [Bacteroidaceae bacterium]